MKRKTIFITLITITNLVALILIRPIFPTFFGLSLIWKAIYILIFFGFPLWIILPIAILTVPFAYLFKRLKGFKSTWKNITQYAFLAAGMIILSLNTLFMVAKYGMGIDTFHYKKYSEIEGFKGNTDDLKQGEFTYDFGSITRYKNMQFETYPNNEKIEYSIEWISNNEYRLINLLKIDRTIDTIDVKVTNNTEKFYECYVKAGLYAEYLKIWKK